MQDFILTIGCEYGSGGPDIAKMIAKTWDTRAMTAPSSIASLKKPAFPRKWPKNWKLA